MIGAIAGDIIGSIFEGSPIKTKDFPLFSARSSFTDDTVLTVAIADSILSGRTYLESVREYGRAYPDAGFSRTFLRWVLSDAGPYNSYGNGSAMRVIPVGWAFDNEPEVMLQAEMTAAISHNHPEGIKGAQATALAVFMARTGADKETIRSRIESEFGYDLQRTVDAIRPSYRFDASCQGTVPEAIVAFLDSTGFEDAVRNAVSLGGDSDTLACITGAIAEAFYGQIADDIVSEVAGRLTPRLREVTEAFRARFC
ncbi:MAG: ADP-ribosylglycohydrolase family protein [Chthonomonadales bacterium]|nr:ADP-ribosylglycohydrolase family protein [Chthonomonadales bacterium]